MRHIREEAIARAFAEPEVGFTGVAGLARVGQEEILGEAKYDYFAKLRCTGLSGQVHSIVGQVAQHSRAILW